MAVTPGEEAALRSGKGFRWGPFRITYKTNEGLEARCPYHRKNIKTECKKFVDFHVRGPGPVPTEAMHVCLHRVLWWCCQARDFDRQWTHNAEPSLHAGSPDPAFLAAMRDHFPPPPARALTDDELDRGARAAPEADPVAVALLSMETGVAS